MHLPPGCGKRDVRGYAQEHVYLIGENSTLTKILNAFPADFSRLAPRRLTQIQFNIGFYQQPSACPPTYTS